MLERLEAERAPTRTRTQVKPAETTHDAMMAASRRASSALVALTEEKTLLARF
jgi:hypothetical protein